MRAVLLQKTALAKRLNYFLFSRFAEIHTKRFWGRVSDLRNFTVAKSYCTAQNCLGKLD